MATYDITFVVKDDRTPQGFVEGASVQLAAGGTYEYTGSVQEIVLPAGTYTLECWGAEGVAGWDRTPGKGGYAKGDITLTETTTLYLYVGGRAGWNGGQTGGGNTTNSGDGTDIRIGGTAFTDRVIAAGGGGAISRYRATQGGHGGGLEGTAPDSRADYGRQTAGGSGSQPGSFGIGGIRNNNAAPSGGGWYGGGTDGSNDSSGGGGSSYIGGTLSGADMQDVDAGEEFPKYALANTSTETGVNSGDGKIVITPVDSMEELTDVNGEAVFEGIAPNTTFGFTVEKDNYATEIGSILTEEADMQEEVILNASKARVTTMGLQTDVLDPTIYPTDPRATLVVLQVEIGEWYSLAQPIRTRPRPAAARVLPRLARARVGVEPPYGRW